MAKCLAYFSAKRSIPLRPLMVKPLINRELGNHIWYAWLEFHEKKIFGPAGSKMLKFEEKFFNKSPSFSHPYGNCKVSNIVWKINHRCSSSKCFYDTTLCPLEHTLIYVFLDRRIDRSRPAIQHLKPFLRNFFVYEKHVRYTPAFNFQRLFYTNHEFKNRTFVWVRLIFFSFQWVRFRLIVKLNPWIEFDWVRLKFSSIGFDLLCRDSSRGAGGEGTPSYGLYRYVPRNRVWFLRFSVLK